MNFSEVPTFLDEERIGQLWDSMRWFLSFNMPMIMIGVAFFLVAGVVAVIVWIFTRRDDDEDEDEGFDVL